MYLGERVNLGERSTERGENRHEEGACTHTRRSGGNGIESREGDEDPEARPGGGGGESIVAGTCFLVPGPHEST